VAKEQILVCTEDNHSKFWMYTEANGVYTARWGRLGTKGGQSKNYSYPEIVDKVYEKQRKGYKPISRDVFEQKSTEAAIVGTQNKCHDMRWMEQRQNNVTMNSIVLQDGTIYAPVSDQRLQEPDCEPALLVRLETRKEFAGQKDFQLMFTPDGSYLLHDDQGVSVRHNHRGTVASGIMKRTKIVKGHDLYPMVEKVEEALGRGLS
jgi:predicted DNA-binding WGR domain protein